MIAENKAIKICNYFPNFIFGSGSIFVEKYYVWISSQLIFFLKTLLFVNAAHDINLKCTR